MKRGYLIMFVIFLVFSSYLFPLSVSSSEPNREAVKTLLQQYGKDAVIQAILKVRNSCITVIYKGRYLEFIGPPSSEYINADTVLMDLKKTGLRVEDLRGLLKKEKEEMVLHPPLATGPTFREERRGPAWEKRGRVLKDLRTAAIRCWLTDFLEFMDPETAALVRRFEGIRERLNAELNELATRSREWFGDRVRFEGSNIYYLIKGEDPQWNNIFGPYWPRLVEEAKRRNERPRVSISAEFEWTDECKVIQIFQACLEDPSFCKETKVKDSSIQIRETTEGWRLVNTKPLKEWEVGFRFSEGMLKILGWARDYLAKNRGDMDYEELIMGLAQGYTQRVLNLTTSLFRYGKS